MVVRVCLTAGFLALLGAPVLAQTQATFAPPVRIQAGEEFLGAGRLYPSPVMHDVDGDGKLDIVVADLKGQVTVAHRLPGEGVRFGPEKPLEAQGGKALKFHNW